MVRYVVSHRQWAAFSRKLRKLAIDLRLIALAYKLCSILRSTSIFHTLYAPYHIYCDIAINTIFLGAYSLILYQIFYTLLLVLNFRACFGATSCYLTCHTASIYLYNYEKLEGWVDMIEDLDSNVL
ncbi:hypothetical protein GGI43DRAFT_276450 [Trichoderma evansii]